MTVWRQRLADHFNTEGAPTMKGASLAAGLNETYVRDVLERGREPRVDHFIRLVDALGKGPLDFFDMDEGSSSGVPLLDWVSAGRLVDPASQLLSEDAPLFQFGDLGRGEFFALRVQGDSMDRISPDGSIIIIDRSSRELLAGKAYVFSVRGQVTYKLWRPRPVARLDPYSTNPANEPVFIERKSDLEVIGRVRRTLLDL